MSDSDYILQLVFGSILVEKSTIQNGSGYKKLKFQALLPNITQLVREKIHKALKFHWETQNEPRRYRAGCLVGTLYNNEKKNHFSSYSCL